MAEMKKGFGRILYTPGQKMNNAVYVGDIQCNKDRKAMFICECGNIFNAYIHSVKSGVTKSCGCFRKKYMADKKTTHGLSRSPFYNLYNNMVDRCYNEKSISFPNYGAKGVTVCKEWLDSFINFVDWCKNNGWESGLQLDKDIKGDGLEYSPEKCIFVTPSENSNHRKTSVFLIIGEERKTIADWSKVSGVKIGTIWHRIKSGWDAKDAVFKLVKKNK